MSLPVAPVHDPVANPITGTDLSPEQVREVEAEIRELKREKDAVILAHNYQLPEIQGLADVVGDSLQLAIEAQKVPQSTIVFCGVHFMAESAKVLNPGQDACCSPTSRPAARSPTPSRPSRWRTGRSATRATRWSPT